MTRGLRRWPPGLLRAGAVLLVALFAVSSLLPTAAGAAPPGLPRAPGVLVRMGLPGAPLAASGSGPALPVYLSEQVYLGSGAVGVPSDAAVPSGGAQYEGPGAVTYDPLDRELLVSSPEGLVWYNTTTGGIDHSAAFGTGRSPAPGDVSTSDWAYLGEAPYEVAVDTADDRAYVTQSTYVASSCCVADTVVVLNATTGSFVATVGGGEQLSGIAWDASNDRVYVADSALGRLEVLDGRTAKLVGFIDVPGEPQNIVVDNATDTVYLTSWTNATNSSVVMVNATSGTVIGSIPLQGVGQGFDLALDPVDGHLLVDGASQRIAVLNVSSSTELYSEGNASAPLFVAWDPLDDEFFLSSTGNYFLGSLDIVNAASDRATGVGNLSLSELTTGVAFDPADGDVFATTTNHARLYRVNGTNLSVQGLWPIGPQVAQVAYAPSASELFGPDNQTSSMWIANVSSATAPTPLPNFLGGPVVYDPADGLIWDGGGVVYGGGGYLEPIYPSNNTNPNASWIAVGGWVGSFQYESPGDHLWYFTGCLGEVDPATGSFGHCSYAAGSVNGMSIAPSRKLVFASTGSYSTSPGARAFALHTGNGSVAWATPLPGAQTVAFDGGDSALWVETSVSVNAPPWTAWNITVLNASTGAYLGNVSLPTNETGPIAYDPAANVVLAYVPTPAPSLRVYNGSTGTYLGSLLTDQAVTSMDVDRTTGDVFLASGGSVVGVLAAGAGPHVLAFDATPDVVSTGNATTLATNATGGTGPLTYSYAGLPPGCASANVSALACTPTASGQFNVEVTVRDANGPVGSAIASLVVVAPLTMDGFSVGPPLDLLGRTVNFTGTVRGGFGPYEYDWTGLPPGCTSLDVPAPCAPDHEGAYSVALTVVDGFGERVRAEVNLTVRAPIAARLVASRGAVDIGEAVNLTLLLANSTPEDSVRWGGLPSGCTGANVTELACVPGSAGTFHVNATVDDSFLGNVTSNVVTLVVDAALVGPMIAASRTSLDVGQSLTLWANVTGGSGSDTIQWYGIPSSCPATVGAVLTCVVNEPGGYSPSVVVNDSLGGTARANGPAVLVDPVPNVSSLTVSTNSLDVGQSLRIDATVSAPAGVATWNWSGLPAGCAAANASELSCAPSAPGSSMVTLSVTDENGGESLGAPDAPLIVDPALVVTSATADPSTAFAGATIELTVDVSGGSGGLTYAWTAPSGCVAADAATVVCAVAQSGGYTASATVNDTNGAVVISPAIHFGITGGPLAVAGVAASRSTTDVGVALGLWANVSAGLPPYSVAWHGLPAGCPDENSTNLTCRPTTPGSYSVYADATDQSGTSVGATPRALTVAPVPSVVVVVASGEATGASASVTLTALVSGGTPPWTVSWSAGGAPAGSGANRTVERPSSGVVRYVATVSDAVGGSNVSAPATVSARSATTPPGSGPWSTATALEVGLPIGAVAGAGLAWAARARSRRGP